MTEKKEVPVLSNIEVVAFDWDGTLIDTVPYKLAQNLALASEFGNDITEEDVRREWNAASGFNDLMYRLTKSDDMGAIMEVVRRDYDLPEYAKRRFDIDIEGILQQIGNLGRRTALITNLTDELLEIDATSIGLDIGQYFEHIQTIDSWPHKKPDPRVFEPIYEKFGVGPGQVVYIGDELKDAEAARRAGAAFIGVETGMTARQEFDAEGYVSVKSIEHVLRTSTR